MRAPLKICSEADYLQAHITVLGDGPRSGNPALNRVKDRVAATLKKWIVWDESGASRRRDSLSSLRLRKPFKLY